MGTVLTQQGSYFFVPEAHNLWITALTYEKTMKKFSARTSPNFSHFPCQVKHVRFPQILRQRERQRDRERQRQRLRETETDRERQRETQNIFSIASVTQRIIRTRSSIFYYMTDMSIYTRNLPVCNSVHYIYVTGLRNFFFVLQDLTERVSS